MTDSADRALAWLNNLDSHRAQTEFLRCCGSESWASLMVQKRPFHDRSKLVTAADEIWNALTPEDWKKAFDRHPRIGQRNISGDKPGSTKKWAQDEQSGVTSANRRLLEQLSEANMAYERKFGYIFIICATGLSAETILENLESRLRNPPEAEILIAAEEQRKIARMRLEKLLSSETAQVDIGGR